MMARRALLFSIITAVMLAALAVGIVSHGSFPAAAQTPIRLKMRDPFFRKVWQSQRDYAALVVPAKRLMFPEYSFAANRYWPPKK